MILFLDFDGVVHPNACTAETEFCPAIESVLREFLHIEIVISSAWRFRDQDEAQSLASLRARFSPDIARRIVGMTPCHSDLPPERTTDGLRSFEHRLQDYEREWECVAWMRTHRTEGTPWLALDSSDELFRPYCNNLMLLNSVTGFEPGELRKRLDRLGEVKPVLFLDVDGVLHPEPAFSKDAFCRLPLVEGILRDFPMVEIVISSSWRLDWKYEDESIVQMRRHFSSDIAPRVIGVTPDQRYYDLTIAPDGTADYLRERECLAWLHRNRPPGTPWLALDDREWWFRPGSPNVMIVDCDDGFMPANEDELRRRLGELARQARELEEERKTGELK